jgi:hypothetical protein
MMGRALESSFCVERAWLESLAVQSQVTDSAPKNHVSPWLSQRVVEMWVELRVVEVKAVVATAKVSRL